MKFLLLGSGGREHAIAHALANSPQTDRVYVAPGNGGTAVSNERIINIDLDSDDLLSVRSFATENGIDLTLIGPEAPLAAGVVDVFQAAGLPCFGPTQAAAQLESSKAYAKDFMARWDIPTAQGAAFTDFDEALEYLRAIPWRPVLKASGLAAGKGVILPESTEEAETALREMMLDGKFGSSGDRVVIEERLVGYEISLLAVCDGQSIVTLPAARDHKRLLDGDKGPNTGGMGAVAPVLNGDDPLHRTLSTILQKVVDCMREDGTPYSGILYGGFMITPAGPKVLEFNCRFGDPETQAVLPILAPGTLVDYVMAAAGPGLSSLHHTEPSPLHAATVVLASGGYPGPYEKGLPIWGIDSANQLDQVQVYHAGTRLKNGQFVTHGGRVLAVTGLGKTLEDALERAYAGATVIEFEGKQLRSDIGRTV